MIVYWEPRNVCACQIVLSFIPPDGWWEGRILESHLFRGNKEVTHTIPCGVHKGIKLRKLLKVLEKEQKTFSFGRSALCEALVVDENRVKSQFSRDRSTITFGLIDRNLFDSEKMVVLGELARTSNLHLKVQVI